MIDSDPDGRVGLVVLFETLDISLKKRDQSTHSLTTTDLVVQDSFSAYQPSRPPLGVATREAIPLPLDRPTICRIHRDVSLLRAGCWDPPHGIEYNP